MLVTLSFGQVSTEDISRLCVGDGLNQTLSLHQLLNPDPAELAPNPLYSATLWPAVHWAEQCGGQYINLPFGTVTVSLLPHKHSYLQTTGQDN